MGSTNFLQFNPSAANQETDAEYTADATRTDGAGVDAIWPSSSANKTLYQLSTAVAGLMQMMANKGFVVSDANLTTLTSVLMNILTTEDVQGGLESVAYSSSIVINPAAYSGFQITLTGNTALSLTGLAAGQLFVVLYAQDVVGGRTVTFSGFSGAAQPDPTASTISAQLFKVNAALVAESAGPLMSASGINNTPIGAAAAASGAFTSLIANTPASSDDSTNAATTAWAKSGLLSSFGSSGYFTMPAWLGGFTLQWGTTGSLANDTPTSVNFPEAFPTACLVVVATDTFAGSKSATWSAYAWNTTSFTARCDGNTATASWVAIGH